MILPGGQIPFGTRGSLGAPKGRPMTGRMGHPLMTVLLMTGGVLLLTSWLPALAAEQPAVGKDGTTLWLHGFPILDAKDEGVFSIHVVKPSPTGEYLLVVLCGVDCRDNHGVLIKTGDGARRRITGPGDLILESKAEWSPDGQGVFYYRSPTTGAEPAGKRPLRGWIEVNAYTGAKKTATDRTLNLTATYAVFNPAGRAPLPVYGEPERGARIIGSLPGFAQKITITDIGVKVEKQTWVPIRYQGIVGWVNQEFLYEESPLATAVQPVRSSTTSAVVTGHVTYRERLALPAEAVVQVELVELSEDGEGRVLSRQVIAEHGQVPISFDLRYDPAETDSEHVYAVRANILFNGQVWFQSVGEHRVITQGHPTHVEVLVKRAS